MTKGCFLSFSWLLIFLAACQTQNKLEQEAVEKTSAFFSLLKSNNKEELKSMYPGIENLDISGKSDTAIILGTVLQEYFVTVSVLNKFQDFSGKSRNRQVDLYFRKPTGRKLELADSKGLADFSVRKEYQFGLKTGCLLRSDTTDQRLVGAMKKAEKVLHDKAMGILLDLKKDVKVINRVWNIYPSGVVTGRGTIVNNTIFDMTSLTYSIILKNRSNTLVKTYKGKVHSRVVSAGKNTTFSFKTGGARGATQASVELHFDDQMIYNYLATREWTGDECSEYFNMHPKDLASAKQKAIALK